MTLYNAITITIRTAQPWAKHQSFLIYKKVVTHLSHISNSPASHAALNKFILMHWVSTHLGPELGLRNTEMDKMKSVPSQPMETADWGNQVACTCTGPNSHSTFCFPRLEWWAYLGKHEETVRDYLNITACNRGIHLPRRKALKDFDSCI